MQTESKIIREVINMPIYNIIVIPMVDRVPDWIVNANNSL